MRPTALPLLASMLLSASAAARAPAVYVNNVRIDGDGLRGQKFANVDVVFDDNGDVRINARGYKIAVETPPSGAAAPAPANTGHHFYVATVQPPQRTGYSQWDVDIYVNQVFVKRFRSKDADPLYEITRFLKAGANVIHFTARKDEAGERLSTSPADYFELVIGDGELRSGQLMMNKVTSYRRTAAESGSFNTETTLNLGEAR